MIDQIITLRGKRLICLSVNELIRRRMGWDSSVSIVTVLRPGQLWNVPIPKRGTGVHSPGVKRPGFGMTIHLHLLSKLGMSGGKPPFSHMFIRRGYGQVCFYRMKNTVFWGERRSSLLNIYRGFD